MPSLAYLARYGPPIRYPYVPEAWPISTYQTVFAEVPGSAEMPSAARPFSAELVTRLVSRGVSVAPFVLHCGVSSPEQHEPPAAEWYRVPPTSAARINTARQGGHRVVAVGTTAVRALETVTDPGGRGPSRRGLDRADRDSGPGRALGGRSDHGLARAGRLPPGHAGSHRGARPGGRLLYRRARRRATSGTSSATATWSCRDFGPEVSAAPEPT